MRLVVALETHLDTGKQIQSMGLPWNRSWLNLVEGGH
jgi:hypothetical protein